MKESWKTGLEEEDADVLSPDEVHTTIEGSGIQNNRLENNRRKIRGWVAVGLHSHVVKVNDWPNLRFAKPWARNWVFMEVA